MADILGDVVSFIERIVDRTSTKRPMKAPRFAPRPMATPELTREEPGSDERLAVPTGFSLPPGFSPGTIADTTRGKGLITSRPGHRTVKGKPGFHEGFDIGVPIGTPVYAIADGEVVTVGSSGSSGNMVKVHHGNGLTTSYMHLSAFNVGKGDKVTRGQQIALSGNTGIGSTGPHLHFEVQVNGKNIYPDKYFSLGSLKTLS